MIKLILALLISSAWAQQQPPTPETQALQTKLMQEINSNLQCTTSLITMQQQVQKLTDEIKELKEKANAK